MKLIGITGKKRTGKDTIAVALASFLLENEQVTVDIEHFANPIREIGDIFGWSQEQMHNDKDQIHPIWGISWRKFAQQIGTDVFRNTWRTDVWLRIMDMRIDPSTDFVIIPDIRFDNEADYIKSRGGMVIQVLRDTGEEDTHESEQGIWLSDLTIMNNSTLDNLHARCRQLATYLIGTTKFGGN